MNFGKSEFFGLSFRNCISCHILTSDDLLCSYSRVVTKISSCWVNTTSRQGIKRVGISFGSIFFFYFPIKVAGGHSISCQGKSPAPGS